MTTDLLPTDPAQLQALLREERARRERAESELAGLRFISRVPLLNPNPVLRLDGDGQLLFANPAAEMLAQELRQTGPSRVRPQLVQAAVQALRTGDTSLRELTANHLHYLLFTVPVVEEGCAMLYLTDITARRQAEREVREQQEFYETILGHLPAVVTVLDPDQRYQYINPYAEPDPRHRQRRIGSSFAEHCAQQGLPAVLASRRWRLFERAVRTRDMVSWEEKWPTPDGGELYWLCFYQPVFGPEGVLRMVICYGLDITKRRQAEERTRLSEAAMKNQQHFTNQVLDLNPSIILVRDEQKNIVYSNQAMRDWQRLVVEQSGSDTYDRSLLQAEELQHSAQLDVRAIATGQTISSEERVTMPDGESRWYQVVRCPLAQPDGSTRVLIVSTDVTDLKLALRAAQAAATARENFLANMSHEIRTPMNGVLGMANLLAKTGLNEQQRSYAEVIQFSGKHLLNVVNDVLDMAKITAGKLELEQAVFHLPNAVGEALQPLAMQAHAKGLSFRVTQVPDAWPIPWVVGDSHRLKQVLLNLVSNALKFTERGSIVVSMECLSETDTAVTMRLCVADTGCGIAPDKQALIFESFTQAYANTARNYGGTGLGLSISQALVEQMGGTLMLTSVVEEGSTFAFTLVLQKAPREAWPVVATPLAPLSPGRLAGARVLLVEDNPINRTLAQMLLEPWGVVLTEAVDGPEALELLTEQPPFDVVLLDIQLPTLSGLDVVKQLRRLPDPRRAAIPVLALTANVFQVDVERYLAAGFDDYLAKPYEEAELYQKIERLLPPAPASAT